MSSSPRISTDDFPSIKADLLIQSGPYDELYRVRDLDEDIWLLGRFYFQPVDPAKLEELQAEVEKCKSIRHMHAFPIRRKIVHEDRLALFWEYREGTSLEERLHREFGPRKMVQFINSTVQAVIDLNNQGIRCEHLSFHDVLVGIDDMPILTPGTFSHLLTGKGDTTAKVVDYEQRVLNRMGAILLSICFGREYVELIETVQLETDVQYLMERFRDLLNVDPALMAMIAKCLMPIDSRGYSNVIELKQDLESYLNGRAVTVDGIDFHQIFQSWRARQQDQN